MAKLMPVPWRGYFGVGPDSINGPKRGQGPQPHQVWKCRTIDPSTGKECGRVALYRVNRDGYCKLHKSGALERRMAYVAGVLEPKSAARESTQVQIERLRESKRRHKRAVSRATK